MKKILLICSDVVGTKMSGPAIRYVEMAKALAAANDVVLVAPGAKGSDGAPYRILPDASDVVRSEASRADLVVFQGDGLKRFPFLKRAGAVLVADLYCPIPLEYHQSSAGVPAAVRVQTSVYLGRLVAEQLCIADHFICASEKQRDFWLGGLALAGRINGMRWGDTSRANLDRLVSLVPFGMAGQPPIRTGPGLREHFGIPAEDFVAVWGGGIYQWFDPLTPIRAVHRVVAQGHRVHLVFMGVGHPNPDFHEHDMCAQAIALAGELGLSERFVHFNLGWVDYELRQNYLLQADVGVSAHFDNPETRFAFRTRMLDYLWCGLPILATRGDVFADDVAEHGLGTVVDYENVEGWCCALLRLKDDSAFRLECKRRIAGFSGAFTWKSIMDRFTGDIDEMQVAQDRDAIRRFAVFGATGLGIAGKFRQAYAEGGLRRIVNLTVRRLRLVLQAVSTIR